MPWPGITRLLRSLAYLLPRADQDGWEAVIAAVGCRLPHVLPELRGASGIGDAERRARCEQSVVNVDEHLSHFGKRQEMGRRFGVVLQPEPRSLELGGQLSSGP